MKPIKLSELIEALEFDCEDLATYIDLQEGSLINIDRSLIRAVEDGHEIASRDLPDWQNEELENARDVVKFFGKRFVSAPNKMEFHEYQYMERFIGSVDDPGAAEQLSRAIRGKGAFRYFKDTAERLDLLDAWYSFREAAMKKHVIAWAEEKKVPYADDMVKPAS